MFSPAVVVVEPKGADEVVIEDDHEVGQTELDRELALCRSPSTDARRRGAKRAELDDLLRSLVARKSPECNRPI